MEQFFYFIVKPLPKLKSGSHLKPKITHFFYSYLRLSFPKSPCLHYVCVLVE